MAFCFVVGMHDIHGKLKGYENVTAQCHNCGNWSAHCMTEWPFFSICFIPVIPLSFKKYKLVACPICHFKQDLSTRPDVQSQGNQPGGPGVQGGPQGGPPPGGHGPPPGQQGGAAGYYGGK